MVESLKFDGDRRGILFQLVNPGFVETPATAKNPFPMPFLMKVEAAAQRIADGMERGGFEITFPRRFAIILKFLRILPYQLYFALSKRAMGA
jgi:NAD(P)-dependent dehydrogenase (short-subunit alcohol dehydrogenase family)